MWTLEINLMCSFLGGESAVCSVKPRCSRIQPVNKPECLNYSTASKYFILIQLRRKEGGMQWEGVVDRSHVLR